MTLTAQDRARRIKIILFDVDGVLTDGTIWLVPAPSPAASSAETQAHLSKHEGEIGFGVHSSTMMEAKGYSAHDGTAISSGAARRDEVRRDHQAHQRDGGHPRTRPEARICLHGSGLQDAAVREIMARRKAWRWKRSPTWAMT